MKNGRGEGRGVPGGDADLDGCLGLPHASHYLLFTVLLFPSQDFLGRGGLI